MRWLPDTSNNCSEKFASWNTSRNSLRTFDTFSLWIISQHMHSLALKLTSFLLSPSINYEEIPSVQASENTSLPQNTLQLRKISLPSIKKQFLCGLVQAFLVLSSCFPQTCLSFSSLPFSPRYCILIEVGHDLLRVARYLYGCEGMSCRVLLLPAFQGIEQAEAPFGTYFPHW